jgi:hypothetical protein
MIFIAAVAIKMAKTIFSTSKTFQMRRLRIDDQNAESEISQHNALLKNAVLMLAEYGEITIDLVVKNVIIITLDDPNEESESYYQISCQFKFRHLDDQRRIEKILLDLILEAKRKRESDTLGQYIAVHQ